MNGPENVREDVQGKYAVSGREWSGKKSTQNVVDVTQSMEYHGQCMTDESPPGRAGPGQYAKRAYRAQGSTFPDAKKNGFGTS